MNADDLAKILDELGQRLGPAGSHVFELAVRQQIIEGVVTLMVLILAVVTAVIAVRRTHTTWDGDDLDVSGAVGLSAGFVIFVSGLVFLTHGIGQLLNPEYGALRALLEAVKP